MKVNETEYIKQRLEDQIAWYARKSMANQRAYKLLRITEIIAAALIPVLSGYAGAHPSILLIVALLGALIALIAGLLGLYQFQENWTGYRGTSEALKHEKFLFLTKTDPYNIDAAFPLLTQRVESLISKEHSSWAQYMRGAGKEQGKGAS
jgi:hypothetical protein